MSPEELNDSKVTLVARGVWICFEQQRALEDLRDARRLLDQLSDELIKYRLCSQEN